jgi:hypothetical protein
MLRIVVFFPVFRLSLKLRWLKRISLLPVGMLSLAMMHCSCKSGQKFTYPELGSLTKIEVIDINSRKPVKTILDQRQIDDIVKFINRQRGGWSAPTFHFPGTKVMLYFYRDGNFEGHFGISKSSFSMQRKGRYDSKPATDEEVQEILNLIGIEKRTLEWN